MSIILIVFAIIFGLAAGSFLSVAIFRFNTEKSLHGRSICMSCGKQLTWPELIPIISFFILGGRCKGCTTKLSRLYIWIEAVTGLVFLELFLKFQHILVSNGVADFVITYAFYVILFCILIVIAFYDFLHKIIPDSLSLTFGLLAFASVFLFKDFVFNPHMPQLTEVLAGVAVASPLALAFFVTKGNALGFGDVKLELGIGYLLGIKQALIGLILSFWIGGIVSAFLIFYTKKYSLKSEVPFGPFLVAGVILAFFLKIPILDTLF